LSYRVDLKNGPLYVCPVNLEFEGKPRFMINDGVGLFIGNHQVVKIASKPVWPLLNTIPHIGPKFEKEYYLKYLNLRKRMIEGIYGTSFFQRTIAAVSARPAHDWQDH
jgi:hypothetical protein